MFLVLIRRLEHGQTTDVTLLDLQLIKYTRPSVDLCYFFGSSTVPSFRKRFLRDLLKVYHHKLTQELEIFGYQPHIYSLEDVLSDFEDTWGFGFSISCLHIQVKT